MQRKIKKRYDDMSKPIGWRLAAMRADQNRMVDQKPKGFWTQVVYEHIVNNPGCTKISAARSVEHLRSVSLGRSIIKRLLQKNWIMYDGKGLYVVDTSEIIDFSVYD